MTLKKMGAFPRPSFLLHTLIIEKMNYDLCLPWYWEYDIDFVQMIEQACYERGMSFWQITPNDLLESITALYKGEKSFRTILDRSQYDSRFEPIHRWSRDRRVRRINPAELSKWSEDKATMHLEFITAGIHTPYTILLPPFIEQPLIPEFDLTALDHRFVIKPANEGGGSGVILGAFSMDQILRARMEFPEQKYLVQATIIPRTIHGQPAWFRVFYANGRTYPCWWHPLTHVFSVLSHSDESRYDLSPLHEITQRIASICKLDWFSTEIALTLEKFVVVDYVNDGIDTRIQSKAVDGVPDEIIRNIAQQLVLIAKGEKDDTRT
jgi:hypothetical protein